MHFSWVRQSATPVVVRRHCLVMVFEKPEVVENWMMSSVEHNLSQRWHDRHCESVTDDVAAFNALLHARPTNCMLAVPPLHSRQHFYDKLT